MANESTEKEPEGKRAKAIAAPVVDGKTKLVEVTVGEGNTIQQDGKFFGPNERVKVTPDQAQSLAARGVLKTDEDEE